MIDAYAGALGSVGAMSVASAMSDRMAVIAGTSTCHITMSADPAFVPGVWGPYRSVLLPGYWALEGGQSAAGALVDAVIARHGASQALIDQAATSNRTIHDLVGELLAQMGDETALVTRDRHIQPDFHGNRAPLADPLRKGAISGLTLDVGPADLALDYLAALQALGYGTRHVLDEMRAAGVAVSTMVVSGGLAKNRLFLRELSDITGSSIIVPTQQEPVLLGSAIVAATASGAVADLNTGMARMSGDGDMIEPRGDHIKQFHDRKYRVYRRMQDDFSVYGDIMRNERVGR